MTPHYGPYYQDDQAAIPPADWHDPVPIPFLVVADAQTFVLALAPRRLNHSQDKQDCETLTHWLEDALAWLGAGAKTAIGYGRFQLDRAATEAAAEAQRQAQAKREREAALATRMLNLSPLAQELEQEVESHRLDTDKNAFNAPLFIENWLEKLETDPTADALKRFCDLVNTHFPGLLENPDKTKGKKNKPAFKVRQRHIAQRLLALNHKKS
jgi:CRISPR-associated protein Cmr6